MQLLKDPNNTRICKDWPLPPHRPLPTEQIFKENTVDWRLLKAYLKKQGKIAKPDFLNLIKMATKLFRSEPTLVRIDDPVTIVGDIHGQFYDFCRLLEPQVGGDPHDNKYLFLGDYVDRGNFSIEVLILLISLKITYRQKVLILRGNHECRQLTSYFNFRFECLKKYDQHVYDLIMEMFDALPLACIVNNRFLAVHGGISHDVKLIHDISKIDRFHEIPKIGVFCDLVWADPIDSVTGEMATSIRPNTTRGCSYFFGREISKNFLEANNLIAIFRAHQSQIDGFKTYNWQPKTDFPTVITIFSAPNYCDFYNNIGAVIKLAKDNLSVKQFVQSPKPYLLPNFMDLFSWSIPFLIDKVTEMFFHFTKPNKKYSAVELPLEFMDKRKLIEAFIAENRKTVEENMKLMKLKGCPDMNLLLTGQYMEIAKKDGKSNEEQNWELRKKIDQLNQSRPDDL